MFVAKVVLGVLTYRREMEGGGDLYMDVKSLVLLIIGLLGKVRGTTRLHKIAFLAVKEGGIVVDAEFVPHLYGPWSPDVQRALNELVEARLVDVAVDEVGTQSEVPPRIYSLTDDGKELLKTILTKLSRDELMRLLFIIRRYGFMPLTYLLAYIYAKYPEYTKASIIMDRVNEWRRFYGLKLRGLG